MSYRLLIKIAALASTCLMGVSHALAETRMALVIGNSNYTTVTALPNPANDAKAMTKFLSSAGFQVLQAPNLTQGDMRRTVSNFASMVAEKGPDTVALVFYAGHGLQVEGENYLVPVDASIQREADVPLQSMRLADVMNALSSVPSKTRIVIVDACRNNPFSDINKTTGRGLAIVDAPTGSLVSYSTAPGTEAQDGDGANSPYTSALMKIGQEQGLPIEQALKRVRLAVNDATHRQQTPWESSSLTSEFSFFPGAAAAGGRVTPASTAQPANAASARSDTKSVETWQKELKSRTPRDAYEIVVREDKVEAYQAYLALYPSQSLAPTVRSMVERRREMIAWYNAVTINTVVSYQTFLASYASSDFAATANRLFARASSRSVSNATAAFASAGPTCPCTQPISPSMPAPRLKRTDVSPSGNGSGGNGAGTNGTKVVSNPSGGGVVVSDPPVVQVYTPPPVTIVTPRPIHPRWPDKPRGHGGDKPSGDGKSSGTDKPSSSGSDKPSRGIGVRTHEPKLTRVRIEEKVRMTNGSSGKYGRSVDSVKPMRTITTSGFATRGATFNRGMSMGSSPGFRAGFMGGGMGGRMGGGMGGGMGGRRFF